MDIIRLSIPAFFILIAVELVIVWFSRKPYYRLNDSIADLSCGIISQIGGLFLKFFSIGIYIWVLKHASLPALGVYAEWPYTWWAWALSFFLIDHQYYWAHRMQHQTQLGWAGHVVHHSSEEYNLTVALRQSLFSTIYSAPFYLPLALLGVPAEMFVANMALNLLYQFWIHTRVIKKMGVLETVMNTPSHHRVHHGRNPKYIDRNHAGVFIVFDRLYGTFQEEEEEPVYGITTPLNSWNPAWANMHALRDLWHDMRHTKSWWDKLRAPWMPPGWRPADLGGRQYAKEVDPAYRKYDPTLPLAVHVYILGQFALVLGIAVYTLNLAAAPVAAPFGAIFGLALYILLTTSNLGSLHDGKEIAYTSEWGRLLASTAIGAGFAWVGYPVVGGGIVGFGLVSAVWLTWAWSRRKKLALA